MQTYSAKAVANAILSIAQASGTQITPMQVQKLAYLAHGWGLALLGTPLIREEIEAWRYGPVIPTLYHEFKHYGSSGITGKASNIKFDSKTLSIDEEYPEIPRQDEDAHALIERVWEVYGKYTGPQLSNLTHEKGTPWSDSYENGVSGKIIPNEIIKAHYTKLIQVRSSEGSTDDQ